MLYFAYGSNLNFAQMAARCPKAKFLTAAILPNYELTFRRTYATVEAKEGEYVEGAIWEVTPECLVSLDIYEGYPNFYDKQEIEVVLPDGNITYVLVYIMQPGFKLEPPKKDYYECITQGYKDCQLTLSKLKQAKKRTYIKVNKGISWPLEVQATFSTSK